MAGALRGQRQRNQSYYLNSGTPCYNVHPTCNTEVALNLTLYSIEINALVRIDAIYDEALLGSLSSNAHPVCLAVFFNSPKCLKINKYCIGKMNFHSPKEVLGY